MAKAAKRRRDWQRWARLALAVVVFPFALALEINDLVRRGWRRY